MTDNKAARPSWRALLLAGAVVALSLHCRGRGAVPGPAGGHNAPTPSWVKLAVLESNRPDPPPELLDRMARAFHRLEAQCPDPAERLADFVFAGQDEVAKKGKSVTLLRVVEDVATMLEVAKRDGGGPKMTSCAETVALYVTAF